MTGYCEICGIEIEVLMCCSGHECGCMGQPVEPPVCSDKCYLEFMIKTNTPILLPTEFCNDTIELEE